MPTLLPTKYLLIRDFKAADEESAKPVRTSFDNKLLAFRALQRGLKFGNENWRMWMNYMIISMDVGELSEATRALGRLVEERADKDKESCVDIDVLERLVDASSRTNGEGEDEASIEPRYAKPNEGAALARRVFDLIERTILPRISSSPRIFRAYARLLMSQSRYSEALEAHLNAYRLASAGGGPGESSGTINTAKEWREAVVDVEEIVDVLRNLGPRAQEKRNSQGADESGGGGADAHATPSVGANGDSPSTNNWSLQARSILRSFLGRTRRDFEDEPEFAKLEELMEEIRGEATAAE